MRDVSSHFDWLDYEDSVTSETFDPHVRAIVTNKTVSVEYGSAMLVVDNHTGIEGGKLVARAMLRALMDLELSELVNKRVVVGIRVDVDGNVSTYLDGRLVANRQEEV